MRVLVWNVQFLDFECEACRPIHPVVEGLKKDFRQKLLDGAK